MISPISAYQLNPYAAQARVASSNIQFRGDDDSIEQLFSIIRALKVERDAPDTSPERKAQIQGKLDRIVSILQEGLDRTAPLPEHHTQRAN